MNEKILFSFFYFSPTDLVNAKTNIPPGSVNSARYIPRSFASWYISVVVQFYPWFKFYSPLFQTHYHTLPYPKTKENKIQTKDKFEPQHIHHYSPPPLSASGDKSILVKKLGNFEMLKYQNTQKHSIMVILKV